MPLRYIIAEALWFVLSLLKGFSFDFSHVPWCDTIYQITLHHLLGSVNIVEEVAFAIGVLNAELWHAQAQYYTEVPAP